MRILTVRPFAPFKFLCHLQMLPSQNIFIKLKRESVGGLWYRETDPFALMGRNANRNICRTIVIWEPAGESEQEREPWRAEHIHITSELWSFPCSGGKPVRMKLV